MARREGRHRDGASSRSREHRRGERPTFGVARRVAAVLAGGVAALVLVGALASPAGAQQTTVTCGAGADQKRAVFVLSPEQDTTLDFGQDRDVRRLHLDFDVKECTFASAQIDTELRSTWSSFDDTDGRQLEARYFAAAVIRAPDKIATTLEVAPSGDARGTYTGSFVIRDVQGQLVRVPVTVTLRYNRPELLFVTVMIPAVLLGSLVVWGKARLAQASGATDVPTFGNLLAVGAGVVAARLAFGKSYLTVADWGGHSHGDIWSWPITSEEWWTLAVVVATAFVGAATATSLGGDAARRGIDKSKTQAADAPAAVSSA
jgi:hypothetical protein